MSENRSDGIPVSRFQCWRLLSFLHSKSAAHTQDEIGKLAISRTDEHYPRSTRMDAKCTSHPSRITCLHVLQTKIGEQVYDTLKYLPIERTYSQITAGDALIMHGFLTSDNDTELLWKINVQIKCKHFTTRSTTSSQVLNFSRLLDFYVTAVRLTNLASKPHCSTCWKVGNYASVNTTLRRLICMHNVKRMKYHLQCQ